MLVWQAKGPGFHSQERGRRGTEGGRWEAGGESKVCGFGSQEPRFGEGEKDGISSEGQILLWKNSQGMGAPVALQSQGALWKAVSQSVFRGML